MKFEVILIPGKLSVILNKDINGIAYFPVGEFFLKKIFRKSGDIFLNVSILPSDSDKFKIKNAISSCKEIKVGENKILFEKKLFFISLKLLIENLDLKEIKIYVSSGYFRFLKYRIENLLPLGQILTSIAQIKFLELGCVMIYGASVFNQKRNDSFLILAPPGVGKTYTVSRFIKKKNFKYLGEDVTFYDSKNNRIYCVPFSNSWNRHAKLNHIFIKKRINIFERNNLRKKSNLRRIYILNQSSKNEIQKLEKNEIVVEKILSLQRMFFSGYLNNYILRYADYYLGNIKIEDKNKRELNIIKKMVEKSEIFDVYADDHSKFYNMISKNEKNF